MPAAVVVIPLAVLGLVRWLTGSFSEPYSPDIPQDTILPMTARLPGSAHALSDHLRIAAPLALTLTMTLTLVVLALLRRDDLPAPSPALALVAAAIVVQPLLLGPQLSWLPGQRASAERPRHYPHHAVCRRDADRARMAGAADRSQSVPQRGGAVGFAAPRLHPGRAVKPDPVRCAAGWCRRISHHCFWYVPIAG